MKKKINIPTNRTVKELIKVIKKNYPNIINIDFRKRESKKFWFIFKK